MYLAFISPVMIILSAVFLILPNRAVLIMDAGGIEIVEMLIESREFFNKVDMASLSVVKVEHRSMISNLIKLHTRMQLLLLVFSAYPYAQWYNSEYQA